MMFIRTANKNDWQDIIKIYNQAVDDKYCTADIKHTTVKERTHWLEEHLDKKYPIFLSEENGIITGWCSLSPYRPGRDALKTVAEISYYVNKDYRGKGIGSALVNYTIDTARKLGFKNLLAILLDVNEASINLLEKYNFKKWGHLPGIADIHGFRCGQFIYGKEI